MIYALILIVIAGIAEHFKDLSSEGKLKGYWDKNHPAHFLTIDTDDLRWIHFSFFAKENQQWIIQYWWKVGWLQGPNWIWLPVWIRQYISFRDGWHLLRFFSLTLGTAGYLWFGFAWLSGGNSLPYLFIGWLLARSAFSLPETILRWIGQKRKWWI